jgi:lipopolysaccharide biosynthesis regulator YciM
MGQPYAYGERGVMALPLALPAAAAAVLPSVVVARLFARRLRANRGRCRACGYDLRATPEKCPECGATPS